MNVTFKPTVDDFTQSEIDDFHKSAESFFESAVAYYKDKDEWHITKEKQGLHAATVYSKKISNGTKIFKLEGIIELPPEALLNELVEHVGECTSWNTTVVVSKRIKFSDCLDLNFTLTSGALGGVIAPRDFVTLRQWSQKSINDTWFICWNSIEHKLFPPTPKIVRGENKPGCYALERIPGEPSKSKFTWIIDSCLKGYVPFALYEKGITWVLFTYFANLQQHAAKLASS